MKKTQYSNYPLIKREFYSDKVIENYNFNNYDYVIVSDIHLGSRKCQITEVRALLSRILKSEELKGFIILGDFFDLIYSSFKSLVKHKEYLHIFYLLSKLTERKTKENELFKLIIALGNHEIHVRDKFRNDDYNALFEERKKNFIKTFEEHLDSNDLNIQGYLDGYSDVKEFFKFKEDENEIKNKISNFLKNIKFCQYILIIRDKSQSNREVLIDPLEQIKGELPLNNKPYNILCAHGYQFHMDFTRNVAAIFWNLTMKAPKKLKYFLDYFYNGLSSLKRHSKSSRISKILSKRFNLNEIQTEEVLNDIIIKIQDFSVERSDIDEFILDKDKKISFLDLVFEKKDKENLINYIINLQEYFKKLPKRNTKYNERIINVLCDNKLENDISHIIYGHTHRSQRIKRCSINFKNNDVKKYIANTGAWQNVINSSFLLINMNKA